MNCCGCVCESEMGGWWDGDIFGMGMVETWGGQLGRRNLLWSVLGYNVGGSGKNCLFVKGILGILVCGCNGSLDNRLGVLKYVSLVVDDGKI